MLTPNREEFLRMAEGKRMPVFAELLADLDTPLTAFWKLAHDESVSFLLESVTGGEQVARYSMLGVRPMHLLRTKGLRVSLDGVGQADLGNGEDPLDRLSNLLANDVIAQEGLPRFCGGAVGMIGYDFIRFVERLPDSNPDDLDLDDLCMMITDAVVVFDHARNSLKVIVLAEGNEAGYDRAQAEIQRVLVRLKAPLPSIPNASYSAHEATSNFAQAEFEDAVRRVQGYIGEGDGIQMVISQRFSKPADAHPVTIYRALRSLNPSPYMFLMRFGDFDLIGASPELLVSHHQGRATLRPIAGTRPRGKTAVEDNQLAEYLLADQKERAEHIMLIDLGRNDLGKVCATGTVTVDQLMVIERYSHVMHIVSEVSGELAGTVFDLIRATFPAGTLSGAPKVRAMEIIEELEPTRRGIYGGAVGTISPLGDVDLAIAIRTVVLKDGMAHVQAGAGIVFDSVPSSEWQETWTKAGAALQALDLAQRGV